ncbi:glutamine amidotransferase [Murinocardiopsis flavida]|uniref:Gamma-glutamyl-hercynylcysteine sulfoxide hydrolase n=1 Tax=Murinocardiopsis flavida TaxID=645275 RepID=A0A2P8DSL3_9ACTN|nr:ergothioneine biosynthesis protein EgtC [Murinocardiopsis flavida]PSL00198.1 glutamine amidotransferase [Murinocardiopsis flavida]
MCRHLAYAGPPVTLHTLLYEPEHSLVVQAHAPRAQRHGTVNADGFGVGWYPPERAGPLRYRRAMPVWADASFAETAGELRGTCVVAAVRDATVGYPTDESCAQPFRADGRLFSHHGAAADDGALLERFGGSPPPGVLDARAPVDSALLFAHAVREWRAGADLGAGLESVVRAAREASPGRYNLLASDGAALAATAAGDGLAVLRDNGAVLLASEPCDDRDGWQWVPEGSLVRATPDQVSITPIA